MNAGRARIGMRGRSLRSSAVSRSSAWRLLCLLSLVLLAGARVAQAAELDTQLRMLGHDLERETGVYTLEYGEQSLVGRAWLARHAQSSIDVQYFIWSSDNVGTLAAEGLLRAAERGVKVRVIVDDLMIDAPPEAMLALARHPNVEVRIYNPQQTVGVGFMRRITNLLVGFRRVNQRMHDKTMIVDGAVAITGGRNMADEYYDFDHTYNFRDRDALVIGKAVGDIAASFETFWHSAYARPVEALIESPMQMDEVQRVWRQLHDYAGDPANFHPKVRAAIAGLTANLDLLRQRLVWGEVRFVHDVPGKNDGRQGLGGGGQTTDALVAELAKAKRRITIQSPYLVLPEGGMEFFRSKVAAGVKVRIVTNSLASTDNLYAFSGYQKIREALVGMGVEIYEFKPDPASKAELIERYPELEELAPIFSLHAKTFVVDGETTYIGTFNLDPRSANLNTEVGVIVRSESLARTVEASLEKDMEPGNSWRISEDFNPDSEVGFLKRLRLFLFRLLPLDPLL